MNCIALITDFGTFDEYAGVMKGVILSVNPSVSVIDITHHIAPQDIIQAAYTIHASFKYFPKGTVHVLVVDPGVGSGRGIIAGRFKDHIFLAPDNGVLTLLMNDGVFDSLVRVENSRYFLETVSQTFHGRDIFAPVSAHLAAGLEIEKLGPCFNQEESVMLKIHKPFISEDGLTGNIIAFDRFGNLITNISSSYFENFFKDSADHIKISIGKHHIKGLSRSYDSVPPQNPIAVIGSRGYLEIAVNCGSAREYFGVQKGDSIRIRHYS